MDIIPIRRAPTADEPLPKPSDQRREFLDRYFGTHRREMREVALSRLRLAHVNGGRVRCSSCGAIHERQRPQEQVVELMLAWVGAFHV